ncbi:unnamed protein product [Caenorhabditis auriculariae]|uniref:Uncharacterized protein n=1 Tax=Caenorhabditis auriculariae TaxID=2777116 RepID=A0A8S1H7I6_9PELO|nr:unnamed protein product [Caenorhabditis auriculariae]
MKGLVDLGGTRTYDLADTFFFSKIEMFCGFHNQSERFTIVKLRASHHQTEMIDSYMSALKRNHVPTVKASFIGHQLSKVKPSKTQASDEIFSRLKNDLPLLRLILYIRRNGESTVVVATPSEESRISRLGRVPEGKNVLELR